MPIRVQGTIRPLAEDDIEPVVHLIALAMNPDEAEQARKTLQFHFACRRHGLDDSRSYYVLDDGTSIVGVVGLHHYVWGPAENVWLAWFAVMSFLGAMLVGAFANSEFAYLVSAAISVVIMVIPGLIMLRREPSAIA